MCVWVGVCVCVCGCVFLCIHTHTHAHTHTHTHTYARMRRTATSGFTAFSASGRLRVMTAMPSASTSSVTAGACERACGRPMPAMAPGTRGVAWRWCGPGDVLLWWLAVPQCLWQWQAGRRRLVLRRRAGAGWRCAVAVVSVVCTLCTPCQWGVQVWLTRNTHKRVGGGALAALRSAQA